MYFWLKFLLSFTRIKNTIISLFYCEFPCIIRIFGVFCTKYKNDLTAANKQITAAKTALAKAQSNLKNAQKKLEAAKAKLSTAQKTLAQKQEKLKTAASALATAQKQLVSSQSKLSQKETQLKQATAVRQEKYDAYEMALTQAKIKK